MNKSMNAKALTKVLFLFSFTLIISCKKNTSTSPVIVISSPYAGQIFNINDTINVKATITYNSSLQYVKLSLINSDYIPVDVTESLTITGSPMNVNTSYIISNTGLSSGAYYIEITAYDATNLVNSFQQININAIPRKRTAVYVITGSNNANTKVWKVDSAGNISSVISLSGDFANAAISSSDQCLYTTGIYSGNFNCINLNTNTISWNVPAINNGFPTFETVFSNNQSNFIAEYNNVIKGYNKVGFNNFTASTISGTYPHTMFTDSKYLYAEQRDLTGQNINLKVYNIANGAALQEFALNQDIVAIFSINQDSLMVFTNHNGIGQAIIYNIRNNYTTIAHSLPAEKIFSAVQFTPENFLLAMQNNIYTFTTHNFGSYNTFATIPAASAMKYDSLNSQLFIINANNLILYNYPSSTPYNTILFADTLKDISILYNK